MEELFTGALGIEQDEKLYKQEEIVMAGQVDWSKPFSLGEFPIFNQEQSLTCGAQTMAKILGVECFKRFGKFVYFSVRDIYTKRTNKSGGMWAIQAFTIGSKGVSLNELMPTPVPTEENFNKAEDRTEVDIRIAEKFSDMDFPFIELGNSIDAIAGQIQSGHPVALLMRFEYSEWDMAYPKLDPASKESLGHFVAATGFKQDNGVKYIIVEDSWGKYRGDGGKRYLSEVFLKAHCKSALSYTSFELEKKESVPKYQFTRDLTIGSEGEDVKQLQLILQAMGFFPANTSPTGKFYGITRQAVKDCQRANGITPAEGYFGPITRDKINNL